VKQFIGEVRAGVARAAVALAAENRKTRLFQVVESVALSGGVAVEA
jgi:hypothetical protein